MESHQEIEVKTAHQKRIRKKYVPPKLTPLGDLRDLTLGTSPGIGDSQNPTIFRAGT